MAEYEFQREVRTPFSESMFVIDEADREVGRLEVHYPNGMVHATLIVSTELTEADMRSIANRCIQEWAHTIGVDGTEIAIHVYQGDDRGVFANEGPNGRRNGNGHAH